MSGEDLVTEEERTFSASPEEVPRVRHWIARLAEQASFSPVRGDLALAVSEATGNAVLHSGANRLTVRWKTDHRRAEIEVIDDGVFDMRAVSPDGNGGLGIPVMAAVMDEFSIEHGTPNRPGTRVRLVKTKR
jgi:anti-sigma regulatory factor (Ser/Thr protein kinase)